VAIGALHTQRSVADDLGLDVVHRVTRGAIGIVVRAVQWIACRRVIERGNRERVGRVARRAVATLELPIMRIIRDMTNRARRRGRFVRERNHVERFGGVTHHALEACVETAVRVVFRVTVLAACGGYRQGEPSVPSPRVDMTSGARRGLVSA
jgi:hypothetical protein